ncbi:hypothetical protein EHH59_08340 [Neisseria meningitidis]|nr:hypothetical protein EHH59_08340 [Neisseria meningitidis]
MNSTFWALLQWIAMMGMLKVLSDTSIRPTLAEPSFPRKWESRISGFQSFPMVCVSDSGRLRQALRIMPSCSRCSFSFP